MAGMQMMNSGGGPSVGNAASRIYTPSGLPSTDSQLQGLMSNYGNQASGLNSTVDPALLQSYMAQLGINYNPLIQAGQQAGAASTQYGNQLQQMAGQEQAAGQQLYNTAMDPQNALFNKEQQQVTDQSNAIASMYGLGTSGAGAGTTSNNLSNFDINWQNQQLQRQATGLQGLTGANTAAGQFAGAAPAAYLAGGTTPINTQVTAAQAPASAAQYYTQGATQAMSPELTAMNPMLQYMNYGTGGQAQAFNAALGAAQFNSGQQQQGSNALFQGLNSMGVPNNGSGASSFFQNWGNPYGSTSQQNASYGGDPTSTVENFPS